MTQAPWIYPFEAFAGKILTTHKCPGFSLGLAKDGETIYAQGFGYRNAADGLPCTPTTVHGIGSITKSFTCVGIMQLTEHGKLKVDDPVLKYLPEFRTPDPEHTKRITLHHLMTHSAGLPPLPTLVPAMLNSMRHDPGARELVAKIGEGLPEVNTYAELLAYMAEQKYELLGDVGTQFSYSNDSYALLGAIIEQVSGLGYEEYLQKHILEPAGMADSIIDLERLYRHPELTVPYVINKEHDEAVEPSPDYWQAPAMLAAGFLRSTVVDMLRYMEIYRTRGMVGQERILTPASVDQMARPYIKCGPGQYYGYGLMITPQYHGVTLVEHGGAIKGTQAQVLCVPEAGLTGVALSNLGGVPTMKILLGGVNAYLGLPLDTPRVAFPEYACPASLLESYAGEYRSGEGAQMTFRVDEGHLVAELEGKQYATRPAGEHLFLVQIPDREMPVAFLHDAEGKVFRTAAGFRIITKVQA